MFRDIKSVAISVVKMGFLYTNKEFFYRCINCQVRTEEAMYFKITIITKGGLTEELTLKLVYLFY